jgi:hypothetical protein
VVVQILHDCSAQSDRDFVAWLAVDEGELEGGDEKLDSMGKRNQGEHCIRRFELLHGGGSCLVCSPVQFDTMTVSQDVKEVDLILGSGIV